MTAASPALQRIFPIALTVRSAVLGMAVLLVAGLVWLVVSKTQAPHNDAHTVLAAQQTALAHYVARDVEYKIAQRSAALQETAANLPLSLLDKPAALQRWLTQRRLPDLFTLGIAVTDLHGRTLAHSTPSGEHVLTHHTDRGYLRPAVAGNLSIGRPFTSPMANGPLLPMAWPVKDGAGQAQAVLVGITAVQAPGFLSLHPQATNDEDTDFMLVSTQDQLVLASTQIEQVMQNAAPMGVDVVLDRAMAGIYGHDVRRNANGLNVVSAVAPVAGTSWFVLARHTQGSALGPSYGAGRLAFVGGMVALALLAGAAWRLARHGHPATTQLHQWSQALRSKLGRWRIARTPATGHAPYYDALTGLPNAALLDDRLGQALARAQRSGARVGLLHINLDQFSALNAKLGHDAGNIALAEIARRLASIVRETDTLARVEGDTFVVLLGELDSGFESAKIAACAVAAKCLDAVAPAITLQATPCQLRASVGIALGLGQVQADALRGAAARAMYHAKQVGGDRYFVAAEDACMPASPAMANA